MSRTRARRIAAIVLVGALVLSLVGCYKGKVTKKRGCQNDKPCEILVVDGGKERWVTVSKDVFQKCSLGDWFESETCGFRGGMRNVPLDEDNEPLTDTQEKKPKEVCVEAESRRDDGKRALLTITWLIGSMSPDKRKHTIRTFKRCRLAVTGQVAYMLLEHHTIPSTLLCKIYYVSNGTQIALDRGYTTNLGDCKVQASVP